MKKSTVNIIKLMIIILVFGAAYFTLDKILLLKSEDGIEQMQAFYKQPEGTVDAVFVGSSHIFCHVNTGVLWDEYGISGFDLAGAEQPFWNSYYYIKEALQVQNPKVVVLDITTPGVRPIDFQPENWFITNTYGIRRGTDRYMSIKDSSLPQSFKRLLIPLNSVHGRYAELTENDFIPHDDSAQYKGFDPRETTVPFERPDITSVTARGQLSDKETKYLKMIIEYVQGRNIPLLFISSPYIVTEAEQEKFNTIFDIADEYGVPYVDFNKLYDEMGLDFEKDFAEILHLNRSGNAKFTKYLGQYLKDSYDLADHRGDKRYSSWDADALFHRQDDNRYLLRQASDNEDTVEYLKLLNNKNYVIYCTVPQEHEGVNDDAIIPYLEALGLDPSSMNDRGAFILQNGKCIFESHELDFKAAITDGNRRLVFYGVHDEDNDHAFTYVRSNGSLQGTKVSGYSTYTMPTDGIAFYVYDTVTDRTLGGYTIH